MIENSFRAKFLVQNLKPILESKWRRFLTHFSWHFRHFPWHFPVFPDFLKFPDISRFSLTVATLKNTSKSLWSNTNFVENLKIVVFLIEKISSQLNLTYWKSSRGMPMTLLKITILSGKIWQQSNALTAFFLSAAVSPRYTIRNSLNKES